jgi:hypothetical protein
MLNYQTFPLQIKALVINDKLEVVAEEQVQVGVNR